MLNTSPPPSHAFGMIHPRLPSRCASLTACRHSFSGGASYLALFLVLLLQGCSWVESFVIVNLKGDNGSITYELQPTTGFPIFESKPTCYKVDGKGNIDWNQPIEITDSDPDPNIITVAAPTHCAVIIGHLNNDKYERYNQEFINDRKFNLKKLTVNYGENPVQITPAIFDAHFQKKNGIIKYVIK